MSKKSKNPLTKEKLDYLDKHIINEILRRFWSNGPDHLDHLFPATWVGDWNLTKIREDKNGD